MTKKSKASAKSGDVTLPRTESPPPRSRSSVSRKAKATQRTAAPPHKSFPIVGIGCSAGGLEALEKFFSRVPLNCGMGFVVVQHLDPTRASALPELIQRITPMPVTEAGNRMLVKPDCIYLIPPNKDLSILHGVLHLFFITIE